MKEKTQLDEIKEKRIAEFHSERRRRMLAGLEKMLGDVEGRAFLWELLSRSRVYGDCYAPSPTDTAYNLGMRAVGLDLLVLIQAQQPEAIHLMTKENTCQIK